MKLYIECLALFEIQYHMCAHCVKAERTAAIKVGYAAFYKSAYSAVKKRFESVHIGTFYPTVSGKADRCHCKAPFLINDKKKNKPYLRLTNTADVLKQDVDQSSTFSSMNLTMSPTVLIFST